jgi:hypothetical protein
MAGHFVGATRRARGGRVAHVGQDRRVHTPGFHREKSPQVQV